MAKKQFDCKECGKGIVFFESKLIGKLTETKISRCCNCNHQYSLKDVYSLCEIKPTSRNN